MKRLICVGAVAMLTLVGPLSAQATGSDRQRFTVVQLNGGQARVIAAGPIAGVGIDVVEAEVEGPDGTISFTDRFVFDQGTVTVVGTGTASGSLDSRTCVGVRHLGGQFELVGRSGTYQHATGEGSWTGDVTFVLRHGPEGCGEELFSRVIFRFTGTASLAAPAA